MALTRLLHTRKKGKIGEDIACNFLEKQGFYVVDRNFLRKWGELDIIAVKDSVFHFFEVKSVLDRGFDLSKDVHKPEENVHVSKTKHIGRMIETYFASKSLHPDQQFEFHVLSVYMDMDRRMARVKWLKNLIL